jgi:hypothetical protein
MTPENHARILFAYLARLSPKHRAEIEQSMTTWDAAALNLGASANLEASARVQDAILGACAHILNYDRDLIAATIKENTK